MAVTWQCPGLEDWNRFVLDPDHPDREKLARHLKRCPQCQVLVADRKKTWSELETAWSEGARGGAIHLRLLSDAAGRSDSPAQLAAKGDDASVLAEAVTLASGDERLILRAVRDTHTRDLWLYLASDDESVGVAGVLIRAFGRRQEYVTDSEGRVNLGDIVLPAPDAVMAEVRLPAAIVTLQPLRAETAPAPSQTLESPAGDRLRVGWRMDGPARVLEVEVIAVGEPDSAAGLKMAVRRIGDVTPPRLVSLGDGRTKLEGVDVREALEIFLYR